MDLNERNGVEAIPLLIVFQTNILKKTNEEFIQFYQIDAAKKVKFRPFA